MFRVHGAQFVLLLLAQKSTSCIIFKKVTHGLQGDHSNKEKLGLNFEKSLPTHEYTLLRRKEKCASGKRDEKMRACNFFFVNDSHFHAAHIEYRA